MVIIGGTGDLTHRKLMPVKSTEIVVQFKQLPEILFFKEYGIMDPNLLVIKVQPKEGVEGAPCRAVLIQL